MYVVVSFHETFLKFRMNFNEMHIKSSCGKFEILLPLLLLFTINDILFDILPLVTYYFWCNYVFE